MPKPDLRYGYTWLIGLLYHSWRAYGQSSLGQVMCQLREQKCKQQSLSDEETI